ncbi:MAG: iron-sulfur cluster insertion protein ErpA [Pseudomonadota bacterium]|nr:iron-sulfur cluster insertion protein ErpA [Pseudomonadota bacterium]MEC8461195.1 iron-sulfur cluster insertion protein ErpA [Pseudomonadota bacterium]
MTVEITDAAVARVWSLLKEEEDFTLKLRAYITGGGCHGFQYGFTFEECSQEDDFVMSSGLKSVDEDDEAQGGDGSGQITLLVDPISFQYLNGACIDFVDDASGERFVIHNPNAKVTCGCARSFAV